jgi:hypothetical protein
VGELQETLWSLLQYNNPCNYTVSDTENLQSHLSRKDSYEEEFLSKIETDNTKPNLYYAHSAEFFDDVTFNGLQEFP